MTLPVFARPSLRLMLAAIVIALVLTIGNAPFTYAQTFTVFHSFTGGDGSIPNGDLIQDRAGNFYGTTESGTGSSLFGLVYKLDSTGTETVLYRFTGGADGALP